MKKFIALFLALVFAMNFAVVSFAEAVTVETDGESIVTEVEENEDETVADETDEDVTADGEASEGETAEDVQNSLLNNSFIRFLLDLVEILKSTFRFLEKLASK